MHCRFVLKQTVYIVTTMCVSPRLAPYAAIDCCYAMRAAAQNSNPAGHYTHKYPRRICIRLTCVLGGGGRNKAFLGGSSHCQLVTAQWGE